MTENTLLKQSDILARGWTKKMIDAFLSDPVLKNNPYNARSKIKLYAENDVLKAEQTDAFKIAFEKAEKRRNAARKAVLTKKTKLENEMQYAADHIHVLQKPIKDIRRMTLQAVQHRAIEKGSVEFVADCAPEETVRRWMVNHIRHNMTEYDSALLIVNGKVGKDEAYRKFKNIVLDKIAEAYPELAEECEKQKLREV